MVEKTENKIRMFLLGARKFGTIALIGFLILFHLMYFFTNEPKKPKNTDSEISNLMEGLNYQDTKIHRGNISKNMKKLGYFKACLMIPAIAGVAMGVIGGFSAFEK